MRKAIAIGLVIALTGCVTGGASQSQINTAMKKADQAALNCPMQAIPFEVKAGWDKVIAHSEKNCPNTSKINNPTPEQLKASFSCWQVAVKENVKPITKQKKALDTYLANAEKLSKQRQDGTITREEATTNLEPLWWEYLRTEVSYFQMAQCQNAAYHQHVMPVYHNKGILAQFMAKRSEIALEVDEGKLSPQKGDVAIQKALAEFAGAEQTANAALQAQNAQAWRDYSKQLQGYSTDLQRAAAQKQNSGPTNTNCQMVGHQMQCTTW